MNRDIVVDDTVGELVEVGDYKATAKAIEEEYLYGDNKFKRFIHKWTCFTLNQMVQCSVVKLENESKIKSITSSL